MDDMLRLEQQVLQRMGMAGGLAGMGGHPRFMEESDSEDETSTPLQQNLRKGQDADEDDDEDLSFFQWVGRSVKSSLDMRVVHSAVRNFRCYSDLVYSKGSRAAWMLASAYLITVLPLGLMSMNEEMHRQMFMLQQQAQAGQAPAAEPSA